MNTVEMKLFEKRLLDHSNSVMQGISRDVNHLMKQIAKKKFKASKKLFLK